MTFIIHTGDVIAVSGINRAGGLYNEREPRIRKMPEGEYNAIPEPSVGYASRSLVLWPAGEKYDPDSLEGMFCWDEIGLVACDTEECGFSIRTPGRKRADAPEIIADGTELNSYIIITDKGLYAHTGREGGFYRVYGRHAGKGIFDALKIEFTDVEDTLFAEGCEN